MKFFTFIGLAACIAIVDAICPYARQALEDPESFKQYLGKRDPDVEVRQSSGNSPFTTFSEDQEIDVTGVHAWAPPGEGDLRGPCPGLNALANHGYFPRNGVVPLTVGATATQQVYGYTSLFSSKNSADSILNRARAKLWYTIDGLCYSRRWRRCVSWWSCPESQS